MSNSSLILLIAAPVIGFLAGWFLRQFLGQKKYKNASILADKLVEEAKIEQESIKREKLLEAKDEIFQMKQNIERDTKSKQQDLHRLEKQLSNREINLDRKVDILNKKEQNLNQQRGNLRSKEDYLRQRDLELEKLINEQNQQLEKISGLTNDEAKKIQMQNMLEKARKDAAYEVRDIREQAKQSAIREAREIVLQAVQRCPITDVVDTTVSEVKLPDDEMKGRIIGREGRNIRAFESATGIEVLIDDTPETVVLSGFDPIRREVAKQAMEKLIYDGRIHPGRIEEIVEKAQQEIDERILEVGEQSVADVDLHGLHPELIRLLGKQHFRTSYGQNLLQHSKEVALLSGELASQLNLDITLSKRAGLLHDIGKVAEGFGSTRYYEIGVELAKKFGENEIVQNAILGTEPNNSTNVISPITILVQIANSISVSRPGAQNEMLENYIQRMQGLEEMALSFSGTVRAFALQAGRELRVMVEHSIIDDTKAQTLADDLVKKIHDEMEFPGQIRVTVIREFRSVEYAK